MYISRNTNTHQAYGWAAIGLRLVVGTPVLVGLMFLLGLIGWFVQGCPADLAPGRWPFELIAPPLLMLSGMLATVMIVTGAGIFSGLALIVGDALITVLHRLRR